jgi:hypothetical protein
MIELYPLHGRTQANGQVWVFLERRGKRVRRAAASAAAIGKLIEPNASLTGSIEVVIEGLAERLHALHEPTRKIVDMAGIGNKEWPVHAVSLVMQSIVPLHSAEKRQNMAPSPAWIVIVAMQKFLPFVVVGRSPAHVDLRIDRRSASKNVALRDVVSAAVQVLLRNSLMIGQLSV